MNKLFAFAQTLQAELGTNATDGSIANEKVHADLKFQVLAQDGSVLEDFAIALDPSVPNAEGALIFARLADFAAGVVESTPAPAPVA